MQTDFSNTDWVNLVSNIFTTIKADFIVDLQFFDDVEYTLDGMNEKRSIATRCMSTLELASQCSQPTFRLNLRAHSIVPKIFKVLHDAPSDTVRSPYL